MDNLSNVKTPVLGQKQKTNQNNKDHDNALAFLSKINSRKSDNKNNIQPIPQFTQMAMENKFRISSADDIIALFPDAQMAIDIIVSCILSPNDMMTINLIYNFPELNIPDLTKQRINTQIKDYIKNVYSLERDLRTMITEAMFTKGSYVTAIIPEASFDDMINEVSFSMESYLNQNKVKRYISSEDYNYAPLLKGNPHAKIGNVDVTKLMKMIDINDDFYFIKDKNKYLKSVSREGYDEYTRILKRRSQSSNESLNVDMKALFSTKRNFKKEDYIELKDKLSASRKSIGRPLYFKVPSESIIPIYPKGEPDNHIGYFLLVDERGLPLSINKEEMNTPSTGLVNGTNSQPQYNNPLDRTATSFKSFNGSFKNAREYENMEQIFSEILEKNLKYKIEKGKYGDLLTTDKHKQIYRIMFNRALESKETKLIYIPEEMISYFAYKYRANGTGESAFENLLVHYSLRAILLFSKVAANIKNSIPITQVTARIPDEDPDPLNTFEMMKDMVLSNRKDVLPLGVVDPTRIADWLHKAGYEFKLEHGKLGELNMEFSDVTKDIRIPDQEFDDWLNGLILYRFGLTPEMIRPAMEPEFATTIISRNLNLAKRTKQDQDTTAGMLTDLVRKIIRNDQSLSASIRNILVDDLNDVKKMLMKNQEDSEFDLENANDEELINYVISTCEEEYSVTLPEPQTNEAPAAYNAMKYRFEVIDDLLNSVFNDEALSPEVVGDLANYVNTIKGMYNIYFKKKYVLDNDLLPELSELFRPIDEVNPVFTDFNTMLETMFKNFIKYTQGNKTIPKLVEQMEKAREALGIEPEEHDYDNDDENNDEEPTEDEDHEHQESGGSEYGEEPDESGEDHNEDDQGEEESGSPQEDNEDEEDEDVKDPDEEK